MKKISLCAVLIIMANFAYANDLTKTENYYPDGKYGIGSRFARKNPTIEKVKNNVRLTVHSYDNGPIHMDIHKYGGGIYFERRFEDHPLSEHGGWSRPPVTQQVNDFHGSIENGKLGVTNAKIYGVEMHPNDAYDAKDGGDHPYDIYTFTVDGESRYTSIREVEKPKPLPTPPNNPYNPNANNDNGNNRQAENGSNDNNSRENQTRLDNANNSSDLANNNSGEVPLPQQDTFWTDLQNNAYDNRALGGLTGFTYGIGEFGVGLVNMFLHPVDTAQNIGNAATAISNDPSIVGQALNQAWDNKVTAYNNAENGFEQGFEVDKTFGNTIFPALTAGVGTAGKANTANELGTLGRGVATWGDDLAKGFGQTQRGAVNVGGKAKGSPLPVSEPTKVTTSSGENLVYKSNQKHTAGQQGYSPRAGTEPRNSADIFSQSKPTSDPTVRYAQDSNGNIHRFFNDSKDGNGTWHWSGSTSDKTVPLKLSDNLKKELQKMGMNSKVLKK